MFIHKYREFALFLFGFFLHVWNYTYICVYVIYLIIPIFMDIRCVFLLFVCISGFFFGGDLFVLFASVTTSNAEINTPLYWVILKNLFLPGFQILVMDL